MIDHNKDHTHSSASLLKQLKRWLIHLLEPLVLEIGPIFAQYHQGELADRGLRRMNAGRNGGCGVDEPPSAGPGAGGHDVDFHLAA